MSNDVYEDTRQKIARAREHQLANAVAQVVHLRSTLILAEASLMKATGGDEYCEYDDVLKTIRAALASTEPALRAMPLQDHGWRDISSAPKDGSYILVGWAGRPAVNRLRWNFGTGEWRDTASDAYRSPTHWMPLPAAPAMVAEEQTEAKL